MGGREQGGGEGGSMGRERGSDDVREGGSGSGLKLKCRQYPAIHTNYRCSNCTISN